MNSKEFGVLDANTPEEEIAMEKLLKEKYEKSKDSNTAPFNEKESA